MAGKVREIAIGPKAQELLGAFAKLDLNAYLFDPREAVAEHHAKRAKERKSKPSPLERSKRSSTPGANHSRRYNRTSYLNAVNRACERAGIEPWTPNQLRHTAATMIRAEFGLEAAQAILGHAKADTTQIYAERDLAKAREVMSRVG